MIEFKKELEEAKFRDPRENFKAVSKKLEIRSDPLTSMKCRICTERAERVEQTEETAEFRKLITKSKQECPFCPNNLDSKTPKFSGKLLKRIREDRIRVGETCVFPNLYPFAKFHAVAVLSNTHYLQLDKFTPKLLQDCFTACLRYFKHLQEENSEQRFWYINWNWMPPGAASKIHPHMQLFANKRRTFYLDRLIQKSREYHEKKQRNYWEDLVKTEKNRKKRYICQSGKVHWMTSFAPQGNNEVLAVVEDASSLANLKDKLNDFCEGFSNVLEGYHELDVRSKGHKPCVRSMNFATFSGPSDEDVREYYWLNAKLITRPSPTPFYTSDCGFMEKLHLTPVIETMPENLAIWLK